MSAPPRRPALVAISPLLVSLVASCSPQPPVATARADSQEPEVLAEPQRAASAHEALPEPRPEEPTPFSPAEKGLTQLSPPRLDSPFPLMKALALRRSQREFSDRPLPEQVLADLLWATAGINRPDEGRRTAPSAHNRQEVDLYVALSEGLFIYRPAEHALEVLAAADLRASTGKQGYVATAPLNLVYVSDLARMMGRSDSERLEVTHADVGVMAQNASLYSASAGLATVVRGWIDTEGLSAAMKLRPRQRVILAQSVGYPPE